MLTSNTRLRTLLCLTLPATLAISACKTDMAPSDQPPVAQPALTETTPKTTAPEAAVTPPKPDADAPAADAQALMRSRYCAYVREDAAYLLRSWHPSTRPHALAFDDPRPTWLKLDVLRHIATGEASAEVEFVARYRIGGGSVVRMRERSRFLREDGHWYYLDAVER